MMTEWDALKKAVEAAGYSGCQKSKRGVVIWRRTGGVVSMSANVPAIGRCDGSTRCRKDCGKLCVHAEANAIFDAHLFGKPVARCEMLHVKVVDGKPVASGPPSCWQCSRAILRAGLEAMWLLRPGPEDGDDPVLVRYTADEFHRETLKTCGIYPFSVEPGDLARPRPSAWARYLDRVEKELPGPPPMPLAMIDADPPTLEIAEVSDHPVANSLERHYRLASLPLDQWWPHRDVEVVS